MVTRALTIILFISFLLGFSSVYATEINVRSDRNPVNLGESFKLIYESSDSVDDDPDFSVLEPYIEILNRNQNSHVSIINGKYSSKKVWTLTSMAKKVGKLQLPVVSFGSDKSQLFTLQVIKKSDQKQQESGFFTRIRIDQKELYIQQQLLVTQQVFSDKSLSAFAMGELALSGVDVITELLEEEKQYQTNINGRPHIVVERRYAIYPQQVGMLHFSAVLAEGRIGRGSSFFDPFTNNTIVRAQSNELDIEVKSVPDAITADPWLPASNFQLLEQWPENNPQFIEGDPITRTISIKADGLTAAQLPVLSSIKLDGLKQYPDQPMLNNIKNPTGITGYRLEKVALIPTRAGELILPAVKIPWFNTVTKSEEIAEIPQRKVIVIAAKKSTTNDQVAPPPKLQIKPQVNQQPAHLSEGRLEKSDDSMLWIILTVVFASAWLATIVAWVLFSKKQTSTEAKIYVDAGPSVKEATRNLINACNAKDIKQCRTALLSWGQLVYSAQEIRNLAELSKWVADDVADVINDLDAVLYGNRHLEINYDLLLDFVRHSKVSGDEENEIGFPGKLDTLYK